MNAVQSSELPSTSLHLRPKEELSVEEKPQVAEENSLEMQPTDDAPVKKTSSLKRKFNPLIHNTATYQLNPIATPAPAQSEKVQKVSNDSQSMSDSQQRHSPSKRINPSLEYDLYIPIKEEVRVEEPSEAAVELPEAPKNEDPPMEIDPPVAPPKWISPPFNSIDPMTGNPYPAKALVDCYQLYYTIKEAELNKLNDELDHTNNTIKLIADLHNKFAHAKKEDKKADFSTDLDAKKWIDILHKRNPTIFASKTSAGPNYLFSDEANIDIAVGGLDAELKILTADLQKQLMTINNRLEDRSQLTEQARQILKSCIDLCESIVRRLTPR